MDSKSTHEQGRLLGVLDWWGNRLPLKAGVLAVLLSLPMLTIPWLLDDFIQLGALEDWLADGAQARRWSDEYGFINLFAFGGGQGESSGVISRLSGESPWWTADESQVVFWRPISSLLMLIDYRVSPYNAVFAHLHSVVWYGVLVSAAALTLGRIEGFSSRLLTLTILVFCIDAEHMFPVAWLANRNAVVATAFGFLSLWSHISRRRMLSLLFTAAALLSGEFGLTSVAFIFGYALTMESSRLKMRLASVSGHGLVVVAWLLHYAVQGYGARGSGFYASPLTEPVAFLQQAPRNLVFLCGNLLGILPADIGLGSGLNSIAWVHGVFALVFAVVIARWLMPELSDGEKRVLRWLAVSAGLGLIPVLSAEPNGRLLLPASLASSFFAAACLRACWRRRHQFGYKALLSIGVGLHLVLAPVSYVFVSLWIGQAGRDAIAIVEDLAEQIRGETELQLFVLNSSDPTLSLALRSTYRYIRKADSAKVHWVMTSSASSDTTVTREGPASFRIVSDDGAALLGSMVARVFRRFESPVHRFSPGDVVDVSAQGYSVRINALDSQASANPTDIRLDWQFDGLGVERRFVWWTGERLEVQTVDEFFSDGASVSLPWFPGPIGR